MAPDDGWPEGAALQLELLQENVYADLARRMGLQGPGQAYKVFAEDPIPLHFWEGRAVEELSTMIGEKPDSEIENKPFSEHISNTFSNYRKNILTLKLPTPYESPPLFYVLAEMVRSIRLAVSADDLRHILPPPLIFGTLPTGQVNAQAVLTPGSDYYLVLFESGLFDDPSPFLDVRLEAPPHVLRRGAARLHAEQHGLLLDLGHLQHLVDGAVEQAHDLVGNARRPRQRVPPWQRGCRGRQDGCR